MIVIPGRIPIAIHPFFWLLASVIGWMYSQSVTGVFIWIGIIFFSVLIHEFGHALTAVLFRQKAQIQLVALGGLTSFEGPKLRFWQQFLITFNGPLFGFFLFLLTSFFLQTGISITDHPLLYATLKWTQIANLFWTIVNLLPVLPLDGGQLLRIVLEASFGLKGFKAALLIGGIISLLLSFYFFVNQAFLVGAIFFLFAFQGFDSWRKSRFVNLQDREDDNRKLLTHAEMALKAGKKEIAKQLFEEVRQKGKGGLLAGMASQYLSFLLEEEGKHEEAYELLLPVKEHLEEDAICLLHKLAAAHKNYPLVAELSSRCYQNFPTLEVALRNARAFAFLKQPKPAGGWLQTASQYGEIDLEQLLAEEEFIVLQENVEFREFVDQLKKR